MKKIYITAIVCLSLILGGCSAIYNWFDSVGQHFPVIGQRCENWQCFSAGGQEASRERIQQQQAAAAKQNATPATSAPASATPGAKSPTPTPTPIPTPTPVPTPYPTIPVASSPADNARSSSKNY